jgi:hypothetical protein
MFPRRSHEPVPLRQELVFLLERQVRVHFCPQLLYVLTKALGRLEPSFLLAKQAFFSFHHTGDRLFCFALVLLPLRF